MDPPNTESTINLFYGNPDQIPNDLIRIDLENDPTVEDDGTGLLLITAVAEGGIIFSASTSPSSCGWNSMAPTAADAGRDPEAMSFIARCQVTITNDPEALYEKRKTTVAMIHSLPGMERLLQSDSHDINQVMADVRKAMRVDTVLDRGGAFSELRREGDLEAARAAIPTSLMSELVVAGDIASVRKQLTDLANIGVTHVFLAAPTEIAELPDIVRQLQS